MGKLMLTATLTRPGSITAAGITLTHREPTLALCRALVEAGHADQPMTVIDGATGRPTDEYSIYARLRAWGYEHRTVCHGRGEYARDEDGDGFCEVNTLEGFWSLLHSWLRPHRGISQEKLPFILASSSSSTTSADAEKPFSETSSPPWSRDNPSSSQNPR